VLQPAHRGLLRRLLRRLRLALGALPQVDANLAASGFDAAADFDTIVSADLFEQLKPAPDIFLAAASNLGSRPANCVVIEDAAAGVQAARAAGGASWLRRARRAAGGGRAGGRAGQPAGELLAPSPAATRRRHALHGRDDHAVRGGHADAGS
jgi:beta-phosphoglucomutase-like phosphatase (HAD superfamily)